MINNNFHHKTVVQVISLTLFLILNFSQGGLLLVDNAALCDSFIEPPLTEPGDIDVVESATITDPGHPCGMSVVFSDGSFNISALTPPEATPADIPVVPNVMGRVPDQLPELISSNSDVTWFSCFWSFFSE
jgi:hypothetical protein